MSASWVLGVALCAFSWQLACVEANAQQDAHHDYEVVHKIVAVGTIPIGLAVMVAGVESLRACVAVLAFFVVGATFFVVGQACAEGTSAEQPVAIACGAVFGVAAAAVCAKFPMALRAGTAFVGGGAGFVVALYINMVALRHEDHQHNNVPIYVLGVALPCIGLVVCGVAYRYGTALALAVLGAFGFVRGIGVLIGGFVDPITFVWSTGPLHNSHAMHYVYDAVIPAFAVLSGTWLWHRTSVKITKETNENDQTWLLRQRDANVYFPDPASSSASPPPPPPPSSTFTSLTQPQGAPRQDDPFAEFGR